MLDLLSLPTSRRDWAILISVVSFAVGALILIFGDINGRGLAAAGLMAGGIALSIIAVFPRRPLGIPLTVVSALLPLAGLYVLLAP